MSAHAHSQSFDLSLATTSEGSLSGASAEHVSPPCCAAVAFSESTWWVGVDHCVDFVFSTWQDVEPHPAAPILHFDAVGCKTIPKMHFGMAGWGSIYTQLRLFDVAGCGTPSHCADFAYSTQLGVNSSHHTENAFRCMYASTTSPNH